jgi:hypothetical protein
MAIASCVQDFGDVCNSINQVSSLYITIMLQLFKLDEQYWK